MWQTKFYQHTSETILRLAETGGTEKKVIRRTSGYDAVMFTYCKTQPHLRSCTGHVLDHRVSKPYLTAIGFHRHHQFHSSHASTDGCLVRGALFAERVLISEMVNYGNPDPCHQLLPVETMVQCSRMCYSYSQLKCTHILLPSPQSH